MECHEFGIEAWHPEVGMQWTGRWRIFRRAVVDKEEDASDAGGGDNHDGDGHRFESLKKQPQVALDNRHNFLMEIQGTSSTCGKCLRITTCFSR